MGESAKCITLPFGRYIAPTAYAAIQQFMQSHQHNDNSEPAPDTVSIVAPDETDSKETTPTVSANYDPQPSQPPKKKKRSEKHTIILNFITGHAECNIKDIVGGTTIPKSTVTRILAELKAEGSIEYVGSKKTGGYRIVEHGE